MVATVVRLKLALLRHSLQRDTWRVVVLLLGGVWALGMLPTVLGGAWWLAGPGTGVRADVLVLAGTLLVGGWVAVPVLVFGTDDTLDPVQFATFGVRVRRLVPALAVASAISVPAVFAALVCAATLVAWSGAGAAALATAVLAAPVSWVTCLVAARVSTLAAARVIGSRRGRRVAAVAVGVVLLLGAVAARQIGALGLSGTLERVPALTRVLGWSPLALSWAAPGAAETGDVVGAGVRIVLAVAWVAVLLWWWELLLRGVLTRPATRGGRARRRFDAILPSDGSAIRAGRRAEDAVAARARRYWASDSRYISAVAGGLLLPILIVGLGGLLSREVAVLLGPLLGATLGWGRHNDTAYDGSAFWMHVVAGLSGAADRRGRVRGVVVWAGPAVVLGSLAGAAFAGRGDLLPAALGAGLGLLTCGLGVSAVTSVVLVYPAPEAGSSPFATETGSFGASMAAQLVSSVATTVLALPVLVGLALALWWEPAVGWAVLAVGLLGGAGVLRAGTALGGRALDTRWVRLLGRVG